MLPSEGGKVASYWSWLVSFLKHVGLEGVISLVHGNGLGFPGFVHLSNMGRIPITLHFSMNNTRAMHSLPVLLGSNSINSFLKYMVHHTAALAVCATFNPDFQLLATDKARLEQAVCAIPLTVFKPGKAATWDKMLPAKRFTTLCDSTGAHDFLVDAPSSWINDQGEECSGTTAMKYHHRALAVAKYTSHVSYTKSLF